MAKAKGGAWITTNYVQPTPKKTRQGASIHTKLSATSRNNAKKRYRGQGK